MIARACALWLILALQACASSGATSSVPSSATASAARPAAEEPTARSAHEPLAGDREGWPLSAIVGPGRGPGLFLGPEEGAPAIGYLSEGVPIEIAGPSERGRVPVRVRSGMRVRGHFPAHRLEARVLQRGRIRDTPVYVGPSDVVRIVGAAGGGRTRVSVTPRIVSEEGAEMALPSYEGSFPAAGLGADPHPSAPSVPGAAITLRSSSPIQVFESPGGRLLVTLPGGQTFRGFEVRRDGGMSAVLLGEGPYLAGYVSEQPVAASAPPRRSAPRFESEGVPERVRRDPGERPLVRIEAGTRVSFDGVTIASVDRAGWAREISRYEETGEVDVFVAVDDAVAVRGMVPIEAVSPASPQ